MYHMIPRPLKMVLIRCISPFVFRKTDAVFVLSTGRSGTLTLTKLLAVDSRIAAYHEPRPHLYAEALDAYTHECAPIARFARILYRARWKLVSSACLKHRIYAETSNWLTFFAPAIRSAIPRTKFIHLVRHPADVVASGLARGWYQGASLDRYRIRPRTLLVDSQRTKSDSHSRLEITIEQWSQMSAFEKACWLWSEINSFVLRFAQTIPESQYTLVRLEDLISNSDDQIQSLWAFLGLNLEPHMLDRCSAVLSIKDNASKYPGSALDELARHQRSLLWDLCGDTAKRLGYAP